MPSRIDPSEVQDDTDYFARLDRERLTLRYPSDPEDDDEEDDGDIESLWDDGQKGGEG